MEVKVYLEQSLGYPQRAKDRCWATFYKQLLPILRAFVA